MVKINNIEKQRQIGWIICESSLEEDSIAKPKIVSSEGKRLIAEGREEIRKTEMVVYMILKIWLVKLYVLVRWNFLGLAGEWKMDIR